MKALLRLSFFFVFVIASPAQAGICSILLSSFQKNQVRTQSPSSILRFSTISVDAEVDEEEIAFTYDEEKWIESLVDQSHAYLGSSFPGTEATFHMSRAGWNTFWYPQGISLWDIFVKEHQSAAVLHEWGHALFNERMNKDSRLIYFFNKIGKEIHDNFFEAAEENNDRSGEDFYNLADKSILLRLGGLAVTLSYPYQEIFADLLATLVLHDANAMLGAIARIKPDVVVGDEDMPRGHDNPLLNGKDFREARGFSNRIKVEEVEKTKFRYPTKKNKYIWKYSSHHRLVAARPMIWNEVLGQRLDHPTAKIRAIMDLIYRVSMQEVFYRMKRPWLWKMSPKEMGRRFSERLRAELRINPI